MVELWDPPTASGKLGMLACSSIFKEQILEITISAAILVVFNHNRAFYFLEQECIPVGCTPPASVAARGGGVFVPFSDTPSFQTSLHRDSVSQRPLFHRNPPLQERTWDQTTRLEVTSYTGLPWTDSCKHYLTPYRVLDCIAPRLSGL